MRFVKANPGEYLVVARRGRFANRGLAGSAFLWPGATHVLVPSTQQEACFEMTQETSDSIPLRFKGIVVYHVTDPEVTARQFDFADGGKGHDQVKALIGHVCLGELRAAVAHLTMDECIRRRKTTLTDAVDSALQPLAQGWGITLDVVQVAQVFIVDQELRRQLEAEVRNAIKARSELSEIQTREGLQVAQTTSERRLQQEGLESEREKARIAGERLRLDKDLERARIEADTPNQLLRIAQQREVLEKEKEKLELEVQVRELGVRLALMEERARQELRKEILPLEQAPEIARSASGLLRGARLSLYGQDSSLVASLTPVLNLLADTLRSARPGGKAS